MEDFIRFLVLVLLFVLIFFLGAYFGLHTGAQQHFKGEIVCQDLFCRYCEVRGQEEP